MSITVSSHILDTTSGQSAMGIRVQLFALRGDSKTCLFDVHASAEGRIIEEVDVDADPGTQYELVFHGADYFGDRAARSTVTTVVMRFDVDKARSRYHMPIMLSPHSYSVWWSG